MLEQNFKKEKGGGEGEGGRRREEGEGGGGEGRGEGRSGKENLMAKNILFIIISPKVFWDLRGYSFLSSPLHYNYEEPYKIQIVNRWKAWV